MSSLPESGEKGGMLLLKSIRSGGSTQGGFNGWLYNSGSGGNNCFNGICENVLLLRPCRHGDMTASLLMVGPCIDGLCLSHAGVELRPDTPCWSQAGL